MNNDENDALPMRDSEKTKHLFEPVVDLQEAVCWVAHSNFAGSDLGPRPLFEFIKDSEPLERQFFESRGREQLALDLLWHHAESGQIRMFGRKASLVCDTSLPLEESHWGEPGNEPEPIAPDFIASATWSEDDGGRIDGDTVSYADLTVHHGNLLKSFPSRGLTGPDRAADTLRRRVFDAMNEAPARSANSLASIETNVGSGSPS